MDELKKKLFDYGDIEVIKDGVVFILLMTGNEMGKKVLQILGLVTMYIKDKPIAEVIKNEDNYVLIVLKA